MLASPSSSNYCQLQDRRLNPRIHVAKIMALSEVYGPDQVARALEDAFKFRAFSSDYIDIELPPVDISVYDPAETASTPDNA